MDFSWLGGLATGAVGAVTNAITSNKAIKAQKEENDKNRQYNWKVMQYQNEQYRQNRDNEREYNLPVNVAQRITDAGLNKDLMYGSGGSSIGITSQNTGVANPAYSNPSDVGSLYMQRGRIGDSILQGLQAMNLRADAQKKETEVSKMKGEIDSITLDNVRKAATTGSMIELDNMQVSLAKSTLNLNEAQLTNLNQMLQNLKSTNDQINADIQQKLASSRNMDSQTLLNRISASLSGKRFDMEVQRFQQELKQSDSSINMTNAQAKKILLTTLAEKMNIDADTLLKRANIRNMDVRTENEVYQQDVIKYEGQTLKFNLGQSQKFDSVERSFKIANESLHSISHLIDSWIPF